ncbi:ATP-binding protein [Myxococcota bacterium]|nr:ATP-binding protein [Myxococcota bacterium]
MSRLQLRIMAALGVLVVAVVGVTGGLAERGLREREMTRLEGVLDERARMVREVLGGVSLRSTEIARLDALADRLGEVTGGRVTLIAPDGIVLGDSEVPVEGIGQLENHADRPEVVRALAGATGTVRRSSQTLKRSLIYFAVPAGEAGAPQGVIRVAIGTESAERAVNDLRRELILAAALGLLAAVVLSYLISWLMTRYVARLRDGVRDIADGQLERRLLWDPRDELGEIAESIDRMAEQLRRQLDEANAENERLEAVLGSMVEGVLVIDQEKVILLANPRFRELFSVWGEVEDRPLGEVVRNVDLDEALSLALDQHEPSIREIEVGSPEPRQILIHSVRFPSQNTQVGAVAVFHDMTDIRRLEEVRSDFIANASHELRTPITSIRGFAETLLNTPPGEDLNSYLKVIERNAERLSNLVDDLLELSRIEGQRTLLQLDEVELVELAKHLVDDLGPRLAGAELEAVIEGDEEVTVWADRHATERVLANLVNNAIQYSDPVGRIRISLHEEEHRAVVEIEDQGIGIPSDDLPRIFERFYRVDRARSRSLGGTGLGLSIVKHLVQGMSGDIQVKSQPGTGSCFRFTLPKAPVRND